MGNIFCVWAQNQLRSAFLIRFLFSRWNSSVEIDFNHFSDSIGFPEATDGFFCIYLFPSFRLRGELFRLGGGRIELILRDCPVSCKLSFLILWLNEREFSHPGKQPDKLENILLKTTIYPIVFPNSEMPVAITYFSQKQLFTICQAFIITSQVKIEEKLTTTYHASLELPCTNSRPVEEPIVDCLGN